MPDISGAVNTATNAATNAVNNVTSNIENTLKAAAMSKLTDLMGKTGLSAQSLLNADPSSIAKSFTNTATKFTKSTGIQDLSLTNVQDLVSKTASTATSNLSDMAGGIGKMVNGAPTELASSLSGVTKNAEEAVVFVTSTSKKAIDTVNLPLADTLSGITDFTSGQITKISSITGSIVGTASNAVKAVTSTIGGIVNAGVQTGAQILGSVTNVANTVLSPVTNIASAAEQLTNPNNVTAIVKNSVGSLPFGLGDVIANKAGQIAGNLHDKVLDIQGKLSSVTDINAQLEKIAGGQADTLFNLSDENGNYVSGYSSSGSSLKEVGAIAYDIKNLCPELDTGINNIVNFGDLNTIFDILVNKAMQSNAGRLLQALKDCGKYGTSNTTRVVRQNLNSVAAAGDAYTVSVASEFIGNSNINDTKLLAKNTIAYNTYDENTKKEIDDMLTKLDVNYDSLYKDTSYTKTNVYDAQSMIYLANTSTKFIDSKVDKETRNTTLNVYNYYKTNDNKNVFTI